MAESDPNIVLAGQREAGALCAHCNHVLELAETVATCQECGSVHHLACWRNNGGCGGYDCAKAASLTGPRSQAPLVISHAELAAAEPLPSPQSRSTSYDPGPPPPRRWNRVAIWAFIISLAGIPLFGLVTGIIAIIVSCVALAGHVPARRGLGLAVMAIVIGLFDVIGWAVGLSMYLGGPGGVVALNELSIDPESLNELPDRLARAMRANVLIQSDFGLGRQGIGSGVILSISDGAATIVTNRHVIDHSFAESPSASDAPADMADMASISVMTVGQTSVPGTVEWVAPHGVDLAIVKAPLLGTVDEVRAAQWNSKDTPHIGDAVFAVGNPHGLGWTHSAGSVSQIRRRTQGPIDFRVLQTTAAINPGNSGGGLYDADGRLIGINTLTGDKRFAEGLGFSIAFPTLLDLIPKSIDLPAEQISTPAEEVDDDEPSDILNPSPDPSLRGRGIGE